MKKISDAIKTICLERPLLLFGLSNKIFNLTALAKLLRPLVTARTKKEVRNSAILMTLSRLQKQLTVKYNKMLKPPIVNITIHSNLASICFYTNYDLLNKIHLVDKAIRNKRGYITVIQGINETNVLVDEANLHLVNKNIKDKPKNLRKNLASLNIQMADTVYETPGQLYYLVLAIALQNLNIYEISSAFSEVIIYLDQKDIKLAFDTIYNCFQNEPTA